MLLKMVEIEQKCRVPVIVDCVSKIRQELSQAGICQRIKPGMKIVISAGSRGIAHYRDILATVVGEVKKAGGCPIIIPAMGSHGGATSEGQIEILKTLGITSESTGAEIRASMEVEEIGRLENGAPVYVDRIALDADGIIVVNRVKPHTDFKGQIESGLMKMMAVGMGKQKGAETIHRYQCEGYHKNIPLTARFMIKRLPIILGLAVVENRYHEIALIKAMKAEEIEKEETRLLKKAKKLIARIPFNEIDVLIIDEIGKNISGLGMDTNVTGRFWIPGECEPKAPRIKRIVVLDLSRETEGNAIGIGLADLTTKRAVDKIDLHKTFVNSLTAGWPEVGRIPVYLPNDREAILTALHLCGPIDPTRAKVVRIKNTLDLNRFWVSENICEMIKSDKVNYRDLEILGKPRIMQFDVLGMLAR
ncbi:nickel-dependent lactate racemase [Candidatus Bathyarchaeota archaeon]|nr:nickel-dependent lactate racemase [Candidatus Bathyarchaeota archaeon]